MGALPPRRAAAPPRSISAKKMQVSGDAAVAVVGAGVVGLACALRLAEDGHAVTLVAPADTEDGASYGNAGVIADYAVLPVGTPQVLRDLPQLLFSRSSPLAIRHRALPALMPWLIRFAWQCRPAAARANARAIATLTAEAAAEWRSLADAIGAREQLRARGSIYLFETTAQRRDADLDWQRALGVTVELLNRAELGQLEPGLLAGTGVGAAFFPDTMTVHDPGTLLRALRARVTAAGVERVHDRVEMLERTGSGVVLGFPDGARLRARQVVLAAGAWSRPLARMAGDRVPLDTERGYHLEFDGDPAPLYRQTTPVARGFYFCPMAGRLRVAGTVELGGLRAPPSPHRWEAIEKGARALLPDLPPVARRWMGFRPSMPDSVPVIGPSRGGGDVVHAFGHGHLGLTLAPVTARMVAAMVAGTGSGGIDPAAYRPERF